MIWPFSIPFRPIWMRRREKISSMGLNFRANGPMLRPVRQSFRASVRRAWTASTSLVWRPRLDAHPKRQWRTSFLTSVGTTRAFAPPLFSRKKLVNAVVVGVGVLLLWPLLWMLRLFRNNLMSKCRGPGLAFLHVFLTFCPFPC